jgi:hypothetical protein
MFTRNIMRRDPKFLIRVGPLWRPYWEHQMFPDSISGMMNDMFGPVFPGAAYLAEWESSVLVERRVAYVKAVREWYRENCAVAILRG